MAGITTMLILLRVILDSYFPCLRPHAPCQHKRDTQEKLVQSERAKLDAEVQAFKVQH